MNKTLNSAYMLESYYLWHSQLRHKKSMYKLMNLSLISSLKFDPNHKCEICVETKFANLPFRINS